jgi:hypothetical protein
MCLCAHVHLYVPCSHFVRHEFTLQKGHLMCLVSEKVYVCIHTCHAKVLTLCLCRMNRINKAPHPLHVIVYAFIRVKVCNHMLIYVQTCAHVHKHAPCLHRANVRTSVEADLHACLSTHVRRNICPCFDTVTFIACSKRTRPSYQ